MINYKPYDQRTPDTQYNDLLKNIKDHGKDKVPIHARLDENKKTGHQNSKETTGGILSYNLENGFPLLTCRNLRKPFFGAIGELVAFINGASSIDDFEKYGCPRLFWEQWVTKEKCEVWGLPEGELGSGSYGSSLAKFHTREKGKTFNQVKALMQQIKNMPFLRTHILSTWNPPYSMGDPDQGIKREVVVAPCHGNFVHFVLFEETKEIEMTHTQRSADVPVGLQFNIAEWCALGMMVSHIIGYKFTKYTHFISNPHFYDVQKESVDKILERDVRPFPTVELMPQKNVTRLEDFRPEDFVLTDDYDPHPYFKIPTPV